MARAKDHHILLPLAVEITEKHQAGATEGFGQLSSLFVLVQM